MSFIPTWMPNNKSEVLRRYLLYPRGHSYPLYHDHTAWHAIDAVASMQCCFENWWVSLSSTYALYRAWCIWHYCWSHPGFLGVRPGVGTSFPVLVSFMDPFKSYNDFATDIFQKKKKRRESLLLASMQWISNRGDGIRGTSCCSHMLAKALSCTLCVLILKWG